MMQQDTVIEGFRLSPQQKHLWLLQSQGQTCPTQGAVLIEGALDTNLLKACLRKLAERHEVLRTTFVRFEAMDTPLQVIAEEPLIAFAEVDGGTLAPGVREEEIGRLLREAETAGSDPATEVPLNCTLLKSGPEEHVLLVTLPALCADAWTLDLFVRELGRLYAGQGEDDGSPDPPTQYADFSEWQNELLESEEDAEAKGYWLEQQAEGGAPPCLPFE
jgi:hypothetical protein